MDAATLAPAIMKLAAYTLSKASVCNSCGTSPISERDGDSR